MAKKLQETIDDFLKGQVEHQEIKSVKEFLSTGSTLLDLAISNRKDGGIPVGRITEIYGWEGTGKSLLTYHILRSCQEKGGLCVYIDTERAADKEFMNRMGVDTEDRSKFYSPPPPASIEGVFELVEKLIKVIHQKGKQKRIVTVVWDSVAASPAGETLEEDFGGGRLGSDSRAMSDCFKRAIEMLDLGYVTLVCINQKRTKIGANKYDTETTGHGRSLGFYSSCRIDIKKAGKMTEGSQKYGRVIGINTKAIVQKSKMGPSHRNVEFPIMFDWGIDDEASWLDYLRDIKVVSTSGAWSTLSIDGEDHKFQGISGFKEKLALPGVHDKLKSIIEDSMVVKYEKKQSFIEDAITEGVK